MARGSRVGRGRGDAEEVDQKDGEDDDEEEEARGRGGGRTSTVRQNDPASSPRAFAGSLACIPSPPPLISPSESLLTCRAPNSVLPPKSPRGLTPGRYRASRSRCPDAFSAPGIAASTAPDGPPGMPPASARARRCLPLPSRSCECVVPNPRFSPTPFPPTGAGMRSAPPSAPPPCRRGSRCPPPIAALAGSPAFWGFGFWVLGFGFWV
ncbi:hypothetical protein T484DRAFT_2281381 [Baffinella frigidus]|nr:hypothetical protein T484DRAFT_2281381 [Cryptophyta sp. CCMP2293]